MCSWRFFFLFLGGAERVLERGDLPAQRADLLIEDFDLRHRARGRRLLMSIWVLSPLTLALPAPAFWRLGGGPAQAVAFALGRRQRGAQLRDLLLETDLAGPLQRQQVGEPRDLRVEARERGVLAGDFLRQKELRHHEHGEQKDDRQDQRRQRVDEARPVIHAAVAAAAGKRHGCAYLLSPISSSSVDRLARQDFHEAPDVAVELGLRVGPVADHLLLGAHVLHQALDRFGEIGHRRGRRLARRRRRRSRAAAGRWRR